ncbi:hypothetical protein EVAR_44299_1 [Eumeta japonica]|uniref:Uncharacterized protein n=1 Tax=Eumeta variegata TaxID=151549 RepID=A0A4C1WPI8_EUMVA|nr:hypothetical protein EVAR_44299_1 [Eumeta japonica]
MLITGELSNWFLIYAKPLVTDAVTHRRRRPLAGPDPPTQSDVNSNECDNSGSPTATCHYTPYFLLGPSLISYEARGASVPRQNTFDTQLWPPRPRSRLPSHPDEFLRQNLIRRDIDTSANKVSHVLYEMRCSLAFVLRMCCPSRGRGRRGAKRPQL